MAVLKFQDKDMFEFSGNTKSHMPFVAHGDAPNFEPKAFCCLQIGGKWKLHHFDGTTWQRIDTGLPEEATECSPTAELSNGKWIISFIAGGYEADRRFYLYKIDGIGNVPQKAIAADVGYIWKNRIVYGGRNGGLFISDERGIKKLSFGNVEYLYRVSYNPNNPNDLLISGQDKDDKIFSWICNITARTLQCLCNDNEPAYKAALFNGVCYYAKRGNSSEDRQIIQAQNLVKTPLNFADTVKIESLENSPSNLQMLQNFTKASFKWAKSGFKIADAETLANRKAVCDTCPYWYAKARMGLGKCIKCGCSSAKLKLASEKCPIGKW